MIQQHDLKIIRTPTPRLSGSNEQISMMRIAMERRDDIQHATEDVLQLFRDLVPVHIVLSEVVQIVQAGTFDDCGWWWARCSTRRLSEGRESGRAREREDQLGPPIPPVSASAPTPRETNSHSITITLFLAHLTSGTTNVVLFNPAWPAAALAALAAS